ncbi:unnamed protein product [Pleuronectes platessa]|uniref:Uncharacterized protein n=1 Tax=Pleuronectes platessa TaxID=8262 RepID=A0A9N7U350_PLEPL|nr:unnamed protein product [Pleuronectes platessa]
MLHHIVVEWTTWESNPRVVCLEASRWTSRSTSDSRFATEAKVIIASLNGGQSLCPSEQMEPDTSTDLHLLSFLRASWIRHNRSQDDAATCSDSAQKGQDSVWLRKGLRSSALSNAGFER